MAHDVFISYSNQDKAVADAVCAMLEASKIRCWIAPRDVPPGQPWPAAIIRARRRKKIHSVRDTLEHYGCQSNYF
jgi:hypothetical protein